VQAAVKRRLSQRSTILLGAAGVFVFTALLQLVVVLDLVSARYLPPPTLVFRRLLELLADREFLFAVADTMRAWGFAMALATLIAVPLGIVLGSAAPLYRAAYALIELLRPIPSVALLPVAILLFGLGTDMKVLLAAYAIFWPLLLNTMYGVRNVDRVMLYTARSFRWTAPQILRRITLPAASPYVATGIRIASAVALIVVLTTEILAAREGMGTVIRGYQEAGRRDFVYAGILATGLLGLLVNFAVSGVERRVLRWTPRQRRA
jgi:ABC-type nitrate/sulfonate/bicarbonate transport system permease component